MSGRSVSQKEQRRLDWLQSSLILREKQYTSVPTVFILERYNVFCKSIVLVNEWGLRVREMVALSNIKFEIRLRFSENPFHVFCIIWWMETKQKKKKKHAMKMNIALFVYHTHHVLSRSIQNRSHLFPLSALDPIYHFHLRSRRNRTMGEIHPARTSWSRIHHLRSRKSRWPHVLPCPTTRCTRRD